MKWNFFSCFPNIKRYREKTMQSSIFFKWKISEKPLARYPVRLVSDFLFIHYKIQYWFQIGKWKFKTVGLWEEVLATSCNISSLTTTYLPMIDLCFFVEYVEPDFVRNYIWTATLTSPMPSFKYERSFTSADSEYHQPPLSLLLLSLDPPLTRLVDKNGL